MNAGRQKSWFPAALSASVAIALYAVTLGGTYVYDDSDIIFNDQRVSHPFQWKLYWTESYNGGVDNLYRPVVSMSYAIQWWVHGDQAWAFHLINILLHAGVSALVAELARRLFFPSADSPKNFAPLAAIAGLLFATSPIHVEAVANIVGRAELMCTLGTVGAMVLFLRRPMTIPRAIAITACFLFALLSKEQGMLVPLLLLMLALCMRWQPRGNAWLVLTLLLCWGLAGYIVMREQILKFWWDRSFLDPTIQPMILSKELDRWLLPFSLFGRYAALLVFPWKLSPDYGGNVIGSAVQLNDPYFYLGIAAALAWLGAAVAAARRRAGAALFCLLGFAATYLVVGNLLTIIGTNFAERLMYLPSVFFILLVVIIASWLPKRLLIGFATIVLLAASWRTFTYARQWNDRLNFYQASLAQQPKAIRLYMLVASELMSQHKLDEAAAVVASGREVMPDYNEIWLQSGVIALEQNRFDEADAYIDHAIHLKPNLKGLGWKEKVAHRRATTNP